MLSLSHTHTHTHTQTHTHRFMLQIGMSSPGSAMQKFLRGNYNKLCQIQEQVLVLEQSLDFSIT